MKPEWQVISNLAAEEDTASAYQKLKGNQINKKTTPIVCDKWRNSSKCKDIADNNTRVVCSHKQIAMKLIQIT